MTATLRADQRHCLTGMIGENQITSTAELFEP